MHHAQKECPAIFLQPGIWLGNTQHPPECFLTESCLVHVKNELYYYYFYIRAEGKKLNNSLFSSRDGSASQQQLWSSTRILFSANREEKKRKRTRKKKEESIIEIVNSSNTLLVFAFLCHLRLWWKGPLWNSRRFMLYQKEIGQQNGWLDSEIPPAREE
jgi:hypothetical protein